MQDELRDIVALFGSALAAAWAVRALRAPAVIGYLLAGIVIGPYGLSFVHAEQVHFFAELGLALLLFTVGLELSPEPLLRMGRGLLIATGLQVASIGLVASIVLRAGFGAEWVVAGLAGFAIALSSTPIVLKQLSDRGEMDSAAGALITGVLLVQDVAVICSMVFLPLLAQGAESSWLRVSGTVAASLGALVAVTIGGRYLLPRLIQQVVRAGPEMLTLFAILTACAGAYLASLANWSWALGACIAGLLLAQSDLRHQLRAEVTPFRDAFSALFFISMGLLVNLDIVARHAAALALAIAAVIVIKTLLTAGSVACAGWTVRTAVAAGLGLCTISEFSYVLIQQAARLGLLDASWRDILVALTVGSMLLGGMAVPLSGPISFAIARRLQPERAADAGGQQAFGLRDHVIIVGYGLNGQNLARVLRATKIPHLIIEQNRANALRAREDRSAVIVGDATRTAILRRAGLEVARALVAVVADVDATRRVVAQAHTLHPSLYILARTRYVSELDLLYRLGAREVIPEEFETSIEIFAYVLKEFAVPDNVIDQQVALVRAGGYGMLRGRATDRTTRATWMQVLEAAVTRTYMLMEASPAAGRTVRELDLRARTGVTMVALTRAGKPTANPSPDLQLEVGDVLVLVGSHKQLDEAEKLLDGA